MLILDKTLLSAWGRLTALSVIFIVSLAGSAVAQFQLVGDLNSDHIVNSKDLRIFAWNWLDPDCYRPICKADIDGVNNANMADLALFANNWQNEELHIVISEFMASNIKALPDGDGYFSDWIEIYNPSGTTINLDGWYLTDDDANLIKWQFPDGLDIKAGEFLIVFASDKTYENNPYNYPYLDSGGYYHTNFSLDKDPGEYLALVAPDGITVIHEYAPAFPAQLTDVSYGLTQYSATLVPRGMTASYHVPTSGDVALGTGWTAADFDDSSWNTGKTGIGFGLGGERMVAYNDCAYRSSDQYIAENVTTYCIGSGNPGPTSGPLVDQVTGDEMGITVTLTESGGVNWQVDPGNSGSDCAVGTDAYNTFGGIADMTGVIYYGSAGWWVELTFTGLDPTTDYTFATSAARNNYTGRLTIYTITGADTYTNASTPGVDVLAEDKVRFNTGDNHNEGYVARWTGITAADGSFTVRAEADPGSTDGKAYSFDVFMLEGGSRGTDIQSEMLGVNSSLWMRTEFNLEEGDPEIFDTLTLRMKYEDGFVAYLNEQEVALRNAPNSVQWDSAALSDRPDANSAFAEVFNIMSFVNALQVGKNVLAIHGLNDSAGDPNFLILPDLVAASNMSVPQYFTTPTPKTFNVPGAQGVVDEVWFSHRRGFYETGFQLILSTGDDDAEIRYTIDGSRPTITHGFTYSSPINVSGTMAVRAVAVKPGWLDSKVETHTYIFVNDVIAQSPNGEAPGLGWPTGSVNGQIINYGMDPDVVLNDVRYVGLVDDALKSIATVSLVTDLDNMFDPTIGIWVNASQKGRLWERPVSVELIYPPNPQGPGFPDLGQVRDSGGGVGWGLPADMRDGFQIDAGMRIRGGYSVSDSNPKHAFRLFFRSEYGDAKLKYPLFGDEGASEYDHVDLRCSQNYSWAFSGDSANTMVREVFSRDVQGMTGHPYTRSRYYHLYVNGHYWGLFQTQERSEASHAESYLGGDKEDYDVVKTPGMVATDGNRDALDRLYDETMLGLDNYERYYRVQGLNLDGTPNPNYERLLDVDNVIDFMIIEYYTGDRDGPASRYTGRPNNTWGCFNRVNPDGWKWYHHDNEHSLGAGSAELNMVTPFSTYGANRQDFNPHWLHEQLANINVEYRMHFTDHVYRHFYNGGLLSTDEARKHIQNRADQINMAIIAESARWGDSKVHPPRTKDDHWLPEIDDLLYDTSDHRHLTPRVGEVISQFRSVSWYPNVNPPTFNQRGGEVPAGFNMTISNPNGSGNIYYTLDGSDPREALTGNAVGTQYIPPNPIKLTKSTHVKARVLNDTTWSALNEAVFSIGPLVESLRITEIMYHPRNTGNINDPNEEFIELKNIGKSTLNLNLVKFTEGIHFTFSDMELDPDEYVVVVRNQNAFEAQYGTLVNTAGQYTGSLDNNGERIKLEDAIGRTILDFEYKDGWRTIADGDGFSLTIIEPGDSAIYSSEGLVAYWKFDDGSGNTATDSAGINHGTLSGDPTWTAGRISGALNFDGDGDYVSVGPVAPLAGNTVTAQAWIRTSEYAGIWNPVLTQNAGNGYYFYISSGRPAFYIVVGAAYVQAISQDAINPNEWCHVAGTNDGSNLKLYVDGQLKDSDNSTGFLGVSSNAYIGCEPASSLYFNGLIDDVRIYNRAVSESEFQDIANPMGRWSNKDSWRASVYRNGTPGWDDSGILPDPGAVVINEVMAHSNAGPDWIELHNTTSKPINIGGWFLSDNNRDEPNLTKYRIADGTTIGDNDYLVFYQDTDFNNPANPGCNVPFALSENGEEACLSSYLDPNGFLTGYRNVEDFGASQTNVSMGRYYKSSTGNFNFVAMDYNTPDANNAYPKVGPVVINEIMYNPPTGNQNEEYIELHNITGALVTLYRYDKSAPWKFTDGIDYTFSSGPVVTIQAYDYLILAKDLTAFTARYGSMPPGVQVLEGYSGRLSNSGERLQIGMPGDIDNQGNRQYIRIDRVTYSDGLHPDDCPGGVDLWPTEADGLGKSLSRKQADSYGNDVANWEAATPSPGTVNP